jgi:hypothetical protein
VKSLPFDDGVIPRDPQPVFEPQVDDGTFDWDIRKWMVPRGGSTMERNIQELRNAIRVIYRDMAENEIVTLEPTATTTGVVQWHQDSTSIDTYWERQVYLSGGDSTQALAEQYGKLYLNKYKDALLARSFTIGSLYILDDKGAEWPIWSPIKYSKSWFRLSDLFPAEDMLSKSWDRMHISQAIKMEYSSRNNELRITLDLEDDSLEALLARMSAFR